MPCFSNRLGLAVESAWTEPNQMAINSWTIRSGVQGFWRGDVSMIHWMQSGYKHVNRPLIVSIYEMHTDMVWERFAREGLVSLEAALLSYRQQSVKY